MIKDPEVRVIGSKGEQLGVLATRDAIKQAQEEGFDLVEVAGKESPPVCRIMDFGKFTYAENKKKRESKKHQTKVEVKECKFRPKIGDHDFDVRIRRAVRFLGKGDKVKLTVMFRGREHSHPELAERLILRAYELLSDLGKMEFPPKKEGRDMHTLIAPLPEQIRKKALKVRLQKGEDLKSTAEDDEIDAIEDNEEEVEEVKEEKESKKKKQAEPESGIPGVSASEIP
jgi:translation initiation factor IF-3